MNLTPKTGKIERRFKPYSSYKDSGVEWLGHVPEHWEVMRGRFCMGVNPKSDKLCKLTNDDEASFVPMEAIAEYGGINLELIKTLGEIGSGYTEFQDGDVVVAKITPCFENGKGALAEKLVNGVAFGTTELHVLRALPNLNKYFLFYVTMSSVYRKTGEAEMYGAGGQKRVPPEFNKNFRTPLPPLPEQRAIAAFLDRETARIDALIVKKERQIELLQEKRTALITHAVAKGLDPSVPMKDSGVEWLGDVPEDWEVKRLKYLLSNKKGALKTGPFGSQLKQSDMQELDVKVYNQRSVLDNDFDFGELYISNNKFFELSEFEIFPEDILLTTRGTIGRCAIFPEGKDKGILHPCLIRIQLNQKKISNLFAKHYIQDSQAFFENVKYNSNATTIDVIYGETLRDVVFVIPARNEQDKIADFLDRKIAQIDALVEKIQKGVELLKEYRTSLITSAVTGKIDVGGELC